MKKWMYVIFPGALLVIFLVVYKAKMADLDARDAAQASEVVRVKAAEAAHKRAIEDKARAEAAQRAAQDAKDAADAAAAREAKWNAEGAKIQAATDKYNADSARFAKKVKELTAQLDALDKEKERLNREDFDLLKAVEAARVQQHNSEMEIQRMVTMIINRAEDSTFTQMPPPPPPPKKE